MGINQATFHHQIIFEFKGEDMMMHCRKVKDDIIEIRTHMIFDKHEYKVIFDGENKIAKSFKQTQLLNELGGYILQFQLNNPVDDPPTDIRNIDVEADELIKKIKNLGPPGTESTLSNLLIEVVNFIRRNHQS